MTSWNSQPTAADYANHAAGVAKEGAAEARFIALCAYASARGATSFDYAADVARGAENVVREAWKNEHRGTPFYSQGPPIESVLRAIDKVLS